MKIILTLAIIVILFNSCQKEISDTSPPNEVSNINIYYYSDSMKLIWEDPQDIDLNSIEIEFDKNVENLEKGIQTKAYIQINKGDELTFCIKTIDNSGNKSKGVYVHGKYDYRSNFLGSFEFLSYTATTFLATTYFDDSISYLGTIFHTNNLDSIINIEYRPGEQTKCNSFGEINFGGYILPLVNVSGALVCPEIQDCSYDINFLGKFQNNNNIIFSITCYADKFSTGQIVEGIRIN